MSAWSHAAPLRRIAELVEAKKAWWSAQSSSRRLLMLALVSLGLLFLRRPFQFLRPDVWVEDGTILIPDTMLHGAGALVMPQNGYLFFVPRLLNFIAMQVPLEIYPEVSTALAVLFDIGVILVVASAPTVLGNRSLCALAILLVPVDSEVYAVPSYTFWFAALLPVVALLWDPDRQSIRSTVAKMSGVLVGGLSSPISVLVLPLFVIRAVIVRTARETACLAVAAATAGAQLWFILPRNASPATRSLEDVLVLVVSKFFGFYLVSPASVPVALVPGIMLVVVIVASFAGRLRSGAVADRLFALLYLFLPLVIGAAIVRAPLALINPVDGGPRYFFLPYVVISWILLNPSGRLLRTVGALALGIAVVNGASHFVRIQDPTDWKGAAREYRETGRAVFPVQFTGEGGTWEVELPPRSGSGHSE